MNNSGIGNMGGNMEGTPISQLLNDVNNVSNIPARINNNINDIKQIVNRLNQEDKIEKEQKRKKKVIEKDTDTETDDQPIISEKKSKKK